MGRDVSQTDRANPQDLAVANAALREEIARRAKFEEALRASEEKYRSLVETTNTGYLIIDGNGVVIDANAEYVRLSGHRRVDEILGRRVTEWTAPHDLERNAREVDKCAALGYVRNLEIDYVDREGRFTPIEINATVLQTAAGVRIISLCRDIGARRRAEAALRQVESRHSQLLETIQAIVWRADPRTFRFSYVSPEAEALLGFPVSRWIDDAEFWPSQIHPEDRDKTMAHCIASTAAGKDHTMEYRMIAADGRVVWLRDLVRVVVVPDRPRELVGVMVDITDRKRAEEEVQELNQTLERRVRDRTAELQAAVAELEAFSYSVSHDLRAPLRAIDGYCQTIAQDHEAALPEGARAMLERVRANAKHMAHLIEGLLTLSRLSRDEMRVEEVDLSVIATSILAELARTEPDRVVETSIAPGLIAHGDPRLLRIVLQNLLANAWKFTSAKPRARIEVGAEALPGEPREFFVRDDGAGFDMAYAGKLFLPFERLHGQSEFPGTGIGLATAARIVQRHGGRIRAEGALGAGATFRFTLGATP